MPQTLDQLRTQLHGPAIVQGDAEYDAARRVFNGMIDKQPQVVVRCTDVGDVMAAVNFARDNSLALSVRGGSHSVPGFGTNDGGVVIDLAPMNGVRVDPKTQDGARGRRMHVGRRSITPPTRSAWRRRAASSRRPASPVSRSAAASAISRERSA